ncbi:MAG: phosphoribosylformylglycinamidine synthase subunit PurS [Planctomycetes bacterium]|nr:phosphoribosylformylglycinamidine synthase subunit PurS [Planctomycetota bacterium]
MRYKIEIFFKKGVLDAEGDATLNALKSIGYSVGNVSSGRIFTIETSLKKEKIEEMCNRLLANPIIHDWKISVLK